MERHPTSFGANTNVAATTELSSYEDSNAIAAVSNAAITSTALPVKSNFAALSEASDEPQLESSLQPVRQVSSTLEQSTEGPTNTSSSEVAGTQPTGASLNGFSIGGADVNHQSPEPALSTQEPELQASSLTSLSVHS